MTDPLARVLVIDDDPINLELVERRLEVAGFSPELVETGLAGLERALSAPFAAVLLDLRLPDLNGLEVLARLRQERPALPVIVMTAHGSEAIAEIALATGAARYLIKPVARQDLLNAVREAIGGPWT
jgi:CheY-like chemotaxis protein